MRSRCSSRPWPYWQRQLGPDHPDTLTSQNNLASAYQDAGRVAEAIQLYELNLAERERLLGVDHPEHPELPGQPRRRLSGRGPGRRGDPAVRADLGRPGTSAGPRSSRYPDLTEEPGQGLPGRGPGRRGDPAARAGPWPAGNEYCAPTPGSRAPARADPASRADLGRPEESGHPPMRPGSASCRLPSASRRSRPGGRFLPASVGLPPTPAGGRFLTALRARMPSCPTIHLRPDAGPARQERPGRPRGRRGDHGGRPGGHGHGVRQVRGCPVRLLPLDAARLGGRSRGPTGHVRHRRRYARRAVRALQAAPVAVRAGPQRMPAPNPACGQRLRDEADAANQRAAKGQSADEAARPKRPSG